MNLKLNVSDLRPFLQQRLPIGHQELSVISLLPPPGHMLQCMLVAEGHLVRAGHVHQTGGVVLGPGARAEGAVHHLVEAEEGLRPAGGGGGAGQDVVVAHQVHQVGGLGGVGGGGVAAAVPQVDQAVRPRLPHVEAGGVAGLRGHALHRLGGRGLLHRGLGIPLRGGVWGRKKNIN